MLDVGLDRLVARHALVRLRRSTGGLPPYIGIVLAASDELVLLRDVDVVGDRLGGFTVLSRSSVEALRHSWMERHRESHVLARIDEADLDPPFGIDLGDWGSLFRSLGRAGALITAEHEHPRHFRYMSGRVVHVNGQTVSLRWPRTLPSEERQTERTPFAEITRVAFA